MQILLVENDPKLAEILTTIFKSKAYQTIHASNAKDGIEAVLKESFDLIILDWMLGSQSGVDLLCEIRDYGISTPVLMLTAMASPEEKVQALDAGADDFLTKPFSTIELLARIRALMRRESLQKQSIVTLGPLVLNTVERVILDNNSPLDLTPKEVELLEYMMLNKNSVLTRIGLSEHLNRDLEYSASSNVVDVHIKNIRKKISKPQLIETVYGVGYRIKE